jgi:hypothetical protein
VRSYEILAGLRGRLSRVPAAQAERSLTPA